MTDPGKVDTYYKYNDSKFFTYQAIFQFHTKVHFVYIMKNYFTFKEDGYFVRQSQE